jgi:hypothetical protein
MFQRGLAAVWLQPGYHLDPLSAFKVVVILRDNFLTYLLDTPGWSGYLGVDGGGGGGGGGNDT